MNLLKETKSILKEHNLTIKDILYVQGYEFGISVENFLKLADTEYDSGYGAQKVANDLIVVGEDWWLERHEYDGAEWWEYKELPKKNPIIKEVTTLIAEEPCIWWGSLAELNNL